jgi:hypothetical protein
VQPVELGGVLEDLIAVERAQPLEHLGDGGLVFLAHGAAELFGGVGQLPDLVPELACVLRREPAAARTPVATTATESRRPGRIPCTAAPILGTFALVLPALTALLTTLALLSLLTALTLLPLALLPLLALTLFALLALTRLTLTLLTLTLLALLPLLALLRHASGVLLTLLPLAPLALALLALLRTSRVSALPLSLARAFSERLHIARELRRAVERLLLRVRTRVAERRLRLLELLLQRLEIRRDLTLERLGVGL